METQTAQFSFAEILDAAMLQVQSGAPLTVIEITVALIVSLICCGWISFLYRISYQGILYQKSFAITILLGGLVTTSIIMVISGNLILSLGMVGALSIVRFRSAIKDPLDIMFLFWTIAVGIANGVGYFKLSLVSVVIISGVFLVGLKFYAPLSHKILVVRGLKLEKAALNKIISHYSSLNNIRSLTIDERHFELITEIRPKQQTEFLQRLRELNGVEEVTCMSYSGSMID
jgi:hypothetical protein